MIFAGCARARPPAGGDGGPGQALGSVRPGHGTEPDSEAITIELIEARVSATSSSRNSFGISGDQSSNSVITVACKLDPCPMIERDSLRSEPGD